MENITYERLIADPACIASFKSRDYITLSCTGCQVPFERKKKNLLDHLKDAKNGVFCSSKCSNQFLNKENIFYVPCKSCETMVRRSKSQILNNVFCSQSCAATYNNKGIQRNKAKDRICKMCDTVFQIGLNHLSSSFCSECLEYRKSKSIFRSEKKEHHCVCGQQYFLNLRHRSKKYCEECKLKNSPTPRALKSDVIKQTSYKEYLERASVKNSHPSWKSAHVRGFNRTWNKDLTKLPCQVCNYSTHVELAHIKAVSDFPEETRLGVINDPSNILVLCRNHHWEFDNGIKTINDIPPRK